MKNWIDAVFTLVAWFCLIAAIWGLHGCVQEMEKAPADGVFVQPKPKPLTVTPHPKFGFELVIVPVGTAIDGFVTTEPGLYICGNALRSLLKEMGLVGTHVTKGGRDGNGIETAE